VIHIAKQQQVHSPQTTEYSAKCLKDRAQNTSFPKSLQQTQSYTAKFNYMNYTYD